MPEAPAWKFKKILRPLFETNKENILFKLRVINPKTLEVIENGFVEIKEDRIILSPAGRLIADRIVREITF